MYILSIEFKRGSQNIIEGIFASNAELVGVIDCDLQHDESKLLEMLELFKRNASLDLVIGSRFTEDGEIASDAFQNFRVKQNRNIFNQKNIKY